MQFKIPYVNVAYKYLILFGIDEYQYIYIYLDYFIINFSLQTVGLQSIIFFQSVPLTNKIQTHSPTPRSHMDDIKMLRRCKDLLKNRKTFLTVYKKKSYLAACQAFFVHPNIFLDYISLCLEADFRVLGFSEAYTFEKQNKTKQERFIEFKLRRKQGMIQNLSR